MTGSVETHKYCKNEKSWLQVKSAEDRSNCLAVTSSIESESATCISTEGSHQEFLKSIIYQLWAMNESREEENTSQWPHVPNAHSDFWLSKSSQIFALNEKQQQQLKPKSARSKS